jgi:hypothetical protein
MGTNRGNRIRNTSLRRLTRPVIVGLAVAATAAAMAAPAAALALSASPAQAVTVSATTAASHRGQLVSATPLRTLPNRAAVTARS